jgi:class 3 adenylate cyclase
MMRERPRSRHHPRKNGIAHRRRLGDVMVDGEQIYGDGVNVPAHLESLAEPGGICISGKVHEEIQTKLLLGYGDLGQQAVNNIAQPVRGIFSTRTC